MSAAKILLTAEEFDNYPFEEDKRYELDEGELIEMTKPAYRHNQIQMRLTGELYIFFKNNPIGELLNSENLFALSSLTRRAPDVAMIFGDRRGQLKNATVIQVIPEIVVEVLSPSERPKMIQRKLGQYFEAGVKEVWIVHPERNFVEIWVGAAHPLRKLSGADSLTSSFLPGFELSLEELFA